MVSTSERVYCAEALAGLGEGWRADPLTELCSEPRGRLLAWLLSAGAAGVLAGGFWWRGILVRPRAPTVRPEQIEAAIQGFADQVEEMKQITVAMQAGLAQLRDRQRCILERIDQSCAKGSR
jgi:hypothetical protein